MSYDLCAFAGCLKTQLSAANEMLLFRTDYQLAVMGNAFVFFPENQLSKKKKNQGFFPDSPAFAELWLPRLNCFVPVLIPVITPFKLAVLSQADHPFGNVGVQLSTSIYSQPFAGGVCGCLLWWAMQTPATQERAVRTSGFLFQVISKQREGGFQN